MYLPIQSAPVQRSMVGQAHIHAGAHAATNAVGLGVQPSGFLDDLGDVFAPIAKQAAQAAIPLAVNALSGLI